MPIPTTKSAPVHDPSRKLTLIYGAPKAGKTTLASTFPNACFLATEAGLGSVSVDRWEAGDGRYVLNSWEELTASTLDVINAKDAAGKPRFTTVIIDTIGNACALCEQWICQKHGEEYKADGKLGYGKGTALIVGELKRYLTKLSATGLGVVLIAHATQKTITTRTGEIQKTVPFVPGDNKNADLYNLILGMCDLVLFVDQDPGTGKRVARTKPHHTYDAGDRTGRLPDPLDASFAALAAAMQPAKAQPATTPNKAA